MSLRESRRELRLAASTVLFRVPLTIVEMCCRRRVGLRWITNSGQVNLVRTMGLPILLATYPLSSDKYRLANVMRSGTHQHCD